MTGIYMIISPTAKVYIGQAISISKRWKAYQKCDCKSQIKLYNSLQKYGYDNHSFEILEECSEEKLNERERFWQEEYLVLEQYGLNCRLTKTDDRSGKLSDATKKKIGEKNKGKQTALGRKVSDATKKKIGEANKISLKGKKLSEKTKRKMSEAAKGKKVSIETRRKLSESQKGRKHSEETKKRISDFQKGKKQMRIYKPSEETKQKISQKLAGRKLSEETIKKRRFTNFCNYVANHAEAFQELFSDT